MGNDLAETPEVSTEEPTVTIEPTESGEPNESGNDEEGEQLEATEVEVTRQGAGGSQPDKQLEINRIISKKVRKLNAKNVAATERATGAEEELRIERERVNLLLMEREQRNQNAILPTPPDPVDFDEGVKDTKYIQALTDYHAPMIEAAVQRHTQHLTPVTSNEQDLNLERKQTKHYERADKLGAKDYEETEDKAISILGKNVVNEFIRNSDKSEIVLYYLGKNPAQAEVIAELIVNKKPVEAMLRLGRLEGELSIKPRANSEPIPDPDEELQGGTPAAGKSNKHQRAYDKAVKAAQESGSMQPVADARKQAIEAGVTLIR